jgi:hypothetical protein
VKRSGRDESIWVVIHMCTKTMLGISLYSYRYVKLAKMLYLSYYCLYRLFNKIGEQVLPGSEEGSGERDRVGEGVGDGREMAPTIYAHMDA